MFMYVFINLQVCSCVCMNICIYMHTQIFRRLSSLWSECCTCIYLQIYMCVYVCICIYVYTSVELVE